VLNLTGEGRTWRGRAATLDRFLLYGQTVSSMVVSSPVPPRPLPVPEAPPGSYRAAQWMVKLSSV
jgi:hypothetical protein